MYSALLPVLFELLFLHAALCKRLLNTGIISYLMNFIYLLYSFFALLLKLLKRGGVKAISAENILLRQQLITLKRRYKHSPKLTLSDRLNYGLLAALINPKRLSKIAVIIKQSTLLKFHKVLVERKYRLLFSNKSKQKPGSKGPSQEINATILIGYT